MEYKDDQRKCNTIKPKRYHNFPYDWVFKTDEQYVTAYVRRTSTGNTTNDSTTMRKNGQLDLVMLVSKKCIDCHFNSEGGHLCDPRKLEN